MAAKRIKKSDKPCEHKKTEKVSWGVYRCAGCGEDLSPNARLEYQLSERVNLTAGDLIKVQGIGLGVFLYANVNQPSGNDSITFAKLESGRWNGTRTVYPDRVKRAPKKATVR